MQSHSSDLYAKCQTVLINSLLTVTKRELVDARPSNASCWKIAKLEDDKMRPCGCKYPTPLCILAKIFPRLPCTPSFIKSSMLHPLQSPLFLLFRRILFVLACIHLGNPRVPPCKVGLDPDKPFTLINLTKPKARSLNCFSLAVPT